MDISSNKQASLTLSLGSAYYFPVIRALSGCVICCWAFLSSNSTRFTVQYGQSQVLSGITRQLPISGDAICYSARGAVSGKVVC